MVDLNLENTIEDEVIQMFYQKLWNTFCFILVTLLEEIIMILLEKWFFLVFLLNTGVTTPYLLSMLNNKIAIATYVFQEIVTKDELKMIENTRLMKYLYLVNLTYLLQNDYLDTPAKTPFKDFKYTAYRNGPVEEYIYSYIQDIRSAILLGEITPSISAEVKPRLDAAIQKVKDVFSKKETSWLVDFTHYMLTEWARTPLFEEMTFSSGGYRTECRALQEYYYYEAGQDKHE